MAVKMDLVMEGKNTNMFHILYRFYAPQSKDKSYVTGLMLKNKA
jgi:hypothetical protein